MKVGAVAFLDALGFKGIWRRWDPDQVLEKVRDAERSIDMIDTLMADRVRDPEMASWVEDRFRVERKLLFVSDTIVIMSWPIEDHAISRVWAFHYVLYIAGAVTRLFGMGGPPHLPLRGCLAWGAFDHRAQFVVGEAVDIAADGEKAVDGAIVWMHEDARTVFESSLEAALEQTGAQAVKHSDIVEEVLRTTESLLVRDYPVPFKTARGCCTSIVRGRSSPRAASVVNPFADFHTETSRTIARNILTSFTSKRADVRAKKANTEALFRSLLA